jgi:translocator protein
LILALNPQPRIRVFLQSGPDEWGSYPGSSAPLSPMLALVGFVGLCLLVGAANAALVPAALRSWYPSLTRPPGTPPDWVFGTIWAVLYVVLGVAAWLVWRRAGTGRALRLWGWQLAANASWGPAFFGLHNPLLALAVLIVLLGLVGLTIQRFVRVQRLAGGLLVPYFAWICYAAWLNAAFYWLNPD